MKELAGHIEKLLQDNDCVIVPQFGGFVAQTHAAVRVEEEELFLPPTRIIGFNCSLQANDGLLVQSLMQAYSISEPEAKRKLSGIVLQLRQELLENGSCDLGGIGILTQNEDGEIAFSPCQAGISSPALYGLDAFSFPMLPERSVSQTPSFKADGDAGKEVLVVRLNLNWLKNIAVAAAAIVLFVLLGPSARNTQLSADRKTMAQSFLPELIFAPSAVPDMRSLQADDNAEKATVPQNDNAVLADTVPEVPSATALATDVDDCPEAEVEEHGSKRYCIVLASQITERNALRFVGELEKRGIEKAEVLKTSRMVRVVYPGFTSEEDAHRMMKQLKADNADLRTAWVMELHE